MRAGLEERDVFFFGKRSGINEVPVLLFMVVTCCYTLLPLGLLNVYRHDFCKNGSFL